MAKAPTTAEIEVIALSTAAVVFHVVGTSPLIFNAMSAKARESLLLGGSKKTVAEKAGTIKHDPPAEYRASVYREIHDKGPTRLMFPTTAFKKAIATAALDVPGAKKTEIGRLAWVAGYSVPVWGTPQIFMSVVRSADMNHTPDIRTRAIVPAWAASFKIHYVKPKLNVDTLQRLLVAAGLICGIGDFRQEKGAGSFGQFRVCAADDAEYVEIVKAGGRKAQDAALVNPQPYDAETFEMLGWHTAAKEKRADKLDAPALRAARKNGGAEIGGHA